MATRTLSIGMRIVGAMTGSLLLHVVVGVVAYLAAFHFVLLPALLDLFMDVGSVDPTPAVHKDNLEVIARKMQPAGLNSIVCSLAASIIWLGSLWLFPVSGPGNARAFGRLFLVMTLVSIVAAYSGLDALRIGETLMRGGLIAGGTHAAIAIFNIAFATMFFYWCGLVVTPRIALPGLTYAGVMHARQVLSLPYRKLQKVLRHYRRGVGGNG